MTTIKDYTRNDLRTLLPFPKKDAHKYSRGHLVIFGGDAAYPGAVSLAAMAGSRMGAGYTSVFCAPTCVDTIRAQQPSLVVEPWKTWSDRGGLESTPDHPLAYVMGCGIDSRQSKATQWAFDILEQVKAPIVVDGGALMTLLATGRGQALLHERAEAGLQTVITPHAGEASYLAESTGFKTESQQEMAEHLASTFKALAVVKGPDTWISDGNLSYCMSEGTAALAKAGTGDVLAGILGALLAQGLQAWDAAVLATHLHAAAGNAAAEAYTPIGVLAEDVVMYIPIAIKRLLEA